MEAKYTSILGYVTKVHPGIFLSNAYIFTRQFLGDVHLRIFKLHPAIWNFHRKTTLLQALIQEQNASFVVIKDDQMVRLIQHCNQLKTPGAGEF